MKILWNAAVLALWLLAMPLQAQTLEMMTNGEVRRVDKATARITLRHDEIKSLEMPPMTMVFRVTDPTMLDKVKPGDKVRFIAEDINGAITIMKLETAR